MIVIEDINLIGSGYISDNGSFIFPVDKELTPRELQYFIDYYQDSVRKEYIDDLNLYRGDHAILHKPGKIGNRPDNRIVANMAHYIVETFNGYFIGVPPKITLDETGQDEKLQSWNSANSFQDKLSEASRLADIYGRSYMLVYQDENQQTCVAVSDTRTSFIIYDDTISHEPLAFVRYHYDSSFELHGNVYFANKYYRFDGEISFDDPKPNVYGVVPAVEFYDNEDRQSVFDNVKTLINALDAALSQKANQNEYFDNAYLKILGLSLPEDEDGNPQVDIEDNQIIYSPDAQANEADIGFIDKPDGDNLQENLIQHLTDLTYQISMVANLNDAAFSGNSSGVALQYKLLPMKNMAASKERKFTQALRQLFRIVFSAEQVLGSGTKDKWQDLSFQFNRNLPINMADEASTAANLTGIVSQETQISTLSFVDDPKKEMQRIADEQDSKMQQAKQSLADYSDDRIKQNEK